MLAINNGKTIKVSKYAMFVPKESGGVIAFSGLTGAIISVDDERYLPTIMNLREMEAESAFPFDESNEVHQCLYSNGILVDSKTDEYELVLYTYERRIVRDQSLNLILITSRQCNLRCVYCYEEHINNHMGSNTYESILQYIEKQLDSKMYTSVRVSLFGGEPFLPFEKVITFLRKAKALCDEYRVPFISVATTNFALVDIERLKLLTECGCFLYQVTLDGLANTHNKHRPNVNGSGSFEQIIKNLRDAKNSPYNFNVILRTNFNLEIVADAKNFYEFIKAEFDDPRFSVHFESIKELGGDNRADMISPDEEANKSREIAKIVSRLRIKNTSADFFSQPFQGVCYASKHNTFVIDYDGSVRKCTVMLDSDKNKVGQLLENGEMLISHSENSCWVCKENRLKSHCKECKILPVCFGGRCAANVVKNGFDDNCDSEVKIRDVAMMLEYVS
ncbi:MAG: radical SAM protein [Clostridiales bacterium]|nr:radical SAM protein [Clostridiales bacterium]